MYMVVLIYELFTPTHLEALNIQVKTYITLQFFFCKRKTLWKIPRNKIVRHYHLAWIYRASLRIRKICPSRLLSVSLSVLERRMRRGLPAQIMRAFALSYLRAHLCVCACTLRWLLQRASISWDNVPNHIETRSSCAETGQGRFLPLFVPLSARFPFYPRIPESLNTGLERTFSTSFDKFAPFV